MAARTVNIAGFCSGTGMLELAVREALRYRGVDARSVVHCERETSAAAALVALGQATGDEAPVWDDIATFDGIPWRGIVDIAVAGLPCPAYSVAGKQAGNADRRAWGAAFRDRRSRIWGPQPHFLRVVAECLPSLVFLENVPPWVRGGHFRQFGEVLCRLGYQIHEPLFVRASDVGAPHRRERVFVLAYADRDERCHGRQHQPGRRLAGADEGLADPKEQYRPGGRGGRRPDEGAARGHCEQLADADVTGEDGGCRPCDVGPEQPAAGRDSESLAHGDVHGRREAGTGHGRYDVTGSGTGLPLFPPPRNDWGAWARVAGLDPCYMPSVESGVPVVADGLGIANSTLLRLGGNGVVPLAAAIAFDVLLSEIGGLT